MNSPCLYLMSSHWGHEPVDIEDELSGQVERVRPSLPMTADEQSALQGMLNEAGTTEPDESGRRILTLSDGGRAELFSTERAFAVMATGVFTPALLNFLFSFMQVGNLMMYPATEIALTIGVSGGSYQDALDGFPTLVADSPEELGVLISGSFADWKRYRDRLAGE